MRRCCALIGRLPISRNGGALGSRIASNRHFAGDVQEQSNSKWRVTVAIAPGRIAERIARSCAAAIAALIKIGLPEMDSTLVTFPVCGSAQNFQVHIAREVRGRRDIRNDRQDILGEVERVGVSIRVADEGFFAAGALRCIPSAARRGSFRSFDRRICCRRAA